MGWCSHGQVLRALLFTFVVPAGRQQAVCVCSTPRSAISGPLGQNAINFSIGYHLTAGLGWRHSAGWNASGKRQPDFCALRKGCLFPVPDACQSISRTAAKGGVHSAMIPTRSRRVQNTTPHLTIAHTAWPYLTWGLRQTASTSMGPHKCRRGWESASAATAINPGHLCPHSLHPSTPGTVVACPGSLLWKWIHAARA